MLNEIHQLCIFTRLISAKHNIRYMYDISHVCCLHDNEEDSGCNCTDTRQCTSSQKCKLHTNYFPKQLPLVGTNCSHPIYLNNHPKLQCEQSYPSKEPLKKQRSRPNPIAAFFPLVSRINEQSRLSHTAIITPNGSIQYAKKYYMIIRQVAVTTKQVLPHP